MADIGYIRTQLNGISDAATRRVLTNCFEHVLGNLRFGPPDQQVRAENFQLYYQKSTTATSTGEVSFRHGLAGAPRLAIPVLDLNQVGARTVPLEVTRVADGTRVYLKTEAGSTNAAFCLLIE